MRAGRELKPGMHAIGGTVYTIAVTDNAFRETGGDDGTLTGIFTGAHHEAAAETLERSEPTAAFGASALG